MGQVTKLERDPAKKMDFEDLVGFLMQDRPLCGLRNSPRRTYLATQEAFELGNSPSPPVRI